MSSEEATRIIALLTTAWPRQKLSRESSALYGAMVLDFDYEETAAAIEVLIRTLTFMPSIAEIRQKVIKNRCQLPDPERAWVMICLRYGNARDKGDKNIQLGPVVIAALDAAGISPYEMHTTQNRHWLKKAFIDIYTVMWHDALDWTDSASLNGASQNGSGPKALPQPITRRDDVVV